MGNGIKSFKHEKIFEIMPLAKKPTEKSLMPFAWTFKRKINPMGDLIKHEARSCAHNRRKIKGADYLSTCVPVAQSTTI